MKKIQKVLIIDDDHVVRGQIRNYFKGAGTTLISAEDGEEGWKLANEQIFDLIILDWKLPNKLSGLALFNRLRSTNSYKHTPILIVSGFLGKQDFRLLQEFPFTGLLEKPFSRPKLEMALTKLFDEAEWYKSHMDELDQLVMIIERFPKEVEKKIASMIKTAPDPFPIALVAARRLIHHNHLDVAERILLAVLKRDEKSVIALHELGRICHMRNDHKDAETYLKRANKVSPQNLARLCMLGDAELNLAKPLAAKSSFAQALDIDENSPRARAGATVASNMIEFGHHFNKERAPRTFASMVNLMGVHLAKQGKFSEAFEQYRSALFFLHNDYDSARVAYNLGLGYLKLGDKEQGRMWLLRSYNLENERFIKAGNLMNQLGISPRKLSDEEMQEAAVTLEVHNNEVEVSEQLADERLSDDFQDADWGCLDPDLDNMELTEENVAKIVGELTDDDLGAIRLEFDSLKVG